MSDWVGILALILAIFAIIIIVVLFYLLFQGNETARSVVDQWQTVVGTTGNADTFVGSPNSIYLVNSANPAGQVVSVTAYSAISTGVSANSTTFFIINNANGANDVIVKPLSGNNITVAKKQSVTFWWVTTTTIAPISISTIN